MVRDISLHGGLKTDKIQPLAGHSDPEPNVNVYVWAYLIFVIFFTQAKFLENKIYTEKRQFFKLNL